MTKLKLKVARKARELSIGKAVVMSDGWRGKVHQIDGDTVICIQEGERPNDWLRGYRAFAAARWLTIDGHKVAVNWSARTTVSARRTVDQGLPHSSVVDLVQARLEREWDGAPTIF